LVFSEIRTGVDSDDATAVRPAAWRDGMRPLWAAVAVACVYFAGVKIGLALTFAPSPISVLWPPNALLLAALILAPFRWWWLLLLAAFPAHLVAELQGGVPTPMVLGWLASNASEALLGAAFFRLAGGKTELATVRDVAVFCATAVIAPFVSSFLDAALVQSLGWRNVDYWTLWRDRFTSNTIATLTFVPVVLTWASSVRTLLQTPPRRKLEGAALLSGLLLVSVVAFDLGWVDVAPASVLYLPVPFLIWAALRFGLPTISLSLTIVTFLIIWGAGHGKGPFLLSVHHESALAIQLFIVSLAVPLLLLAALMQERRAAELKLRASEGLLSSAFQASPDAIAISRESDNAILQANDRWLELFGYDGDRPDRAGGRISSIFSRLDAGQAAGPIESHAEHRDARDVEVALRDRRGELRHVLVSMVTIENQGERCAMNIVRDITGQRRAEVEEREQRQQLTHLTRVASLSDLSSTLAHELNQPLTAILSNSQAALRLLALESPRLSELRTILLDIVAADKRAGLLIHHLRLLMKKGEGEFVPIEVNHLVSDVLRLMHGEFVTRDIDVAVSLAPDLPQVFGDRVQIEQVLLNLVSNAYEAMEAQKGRHKSLSVATAHEHDGTVQIVVTDSGPGLPVDPPDKIFEPFFTTKGDGLGLGLSICRKIARAHGGSLTAENTEAGGARLRLTLVAAEALLRHDRGAVWREAAELPAR